MLLITVHGLLGSGAPDIGRQVADRIRVDYVDREILDNVALKLSCEEKEIVEKESPPITLFGRIVVAIKHGLRYGTGSDGAFVPLWQISLDDYSYFQTLELVVKEIALGKSLVILGRGSQFILKDYHQAFHVQIVAPREIRVKRIMENLKLNQESANEEITRFDIQSRLFFKRYFHAEAEDPNNYDIVINTEHFSPQAAVSIIVYSLPFKNGKKFS